jgi:hypothetical protein
LALGLVLTEDGRNPICDISEGYELFLQYGSTIFGKPKSKLDTVNLIYNNILVMFK